MSQVPLDFFVLTCGLTTLFGLATALMYFNPYFSTVCSTAEVEIKMRILSLCFHLSCLFHLNAVPTNTENSIFFLYLFVHFSSYAIV